MLHLKYILSHRPAAAIVAVNLAIFLAFLLTSLFGEAASARFVGSLVMPGDLQMLAQRPWTPLTSVFSHFSLLHLLANMLLLWMFATALYESTPFDRIRRSALAIWFLYIIGGLAGCLAFLFVASPSQSLSGASASVLAIMAAAAFASPRRRYSLFLFGEVRLATISAIMILLILAMSDTPAMLAAHLGGLGAGCLFAAWLRRGRRVSPTRFRIVNFSGGDSDVPTPVSDASLDSLLDKVSRSGYASLTGPERRRLIEISKNLNHNPK